MKEYDVVIYLKKRHVILAANKTHCIIVTERTYLLDKENFNRYSFMVQNSEITEL
jgi:hypothetical protein